MNLRRRTTHLSLLGCLTSIVLLTACNPVAPPVTVDAETGFAPAPVEQLSIDQSPPDPIDIETPLIPELVESVTDAVQPTEVVDTPEPEPAADEDTPNVNGFVHPGVLVDIDQLSMARAKIADGEQPWTAAFARMRDSGGSVATPTRKYWRFSSLDYPPAPVTEVRCMGSIGRSYAATHPEMNLSDSGCREQTDDAMAAYTHALMWYFTGNPAYAEKSIEIMNAWASTLREIKFDQPRTDKRQQIYAGGLLQAAWTGQIFPRAAEIIRYTYDGWNSTDVAQFEDFLETVIYPVIKDGWSGGANALMSFPEAIMGIGVFNNNRAIFESGVDMWRQNVKTIIYMPSDGSQPIAPHSMYGGANTKGYWFDPSEYLPGLGGETGRDLSHTMMGFGAMSNGAQTASIQGVDLFGEEQDRIVTAYELHAKWINEYLDEKRRLGGTEPSINWRPGGWVNPNFKIGGTAYANGWEITYNHFAELKNVAMPETSRLIPRLRPSGPAMTMIWETVTHAR